MCTPGSGSYGGVFLLWAFHHSLQIALHFLTKLENRVIHSFWGLVKNMARPQLHLQDEIEMEKGVDYIHWTTIKYLN